MHLSRKVIIWSCGILGMVLVASILVAASLNMVSLSGKGEQVALRGSSADGAGNGQVTTAKVVHPRQDARLTVTVRQLVTIEPLFEADLRAQVAGVVRRVPKSIGDPVRRDEVLVDIDVPDVLAELQQKEAIIRQREADVQMALAQLASAQAMKEVAVRNVAIRKAEKSVAIETREFRKLRLDRFVVAAKQEGINQNFVDEERRDYNAAVFTVDVTEANILKAEADVLEKESSVKIARAEIDSRKSLIEVARKDRDRVQARQDFSRLTAPFDGFITERTVQPGQLVQDASAGRSESLLKIDRRDIVTLVMKVPDDSAPYVTRGTEAIVQIDQLPGVLIRGKVTRLAPSILNKDRTLRVEVDLFNGPPAAFWRFAARAVGTWMAPLGATNAFQTAMISNAVREVWSMDARSVTDPFPMLPVVTGREVRQVTLLPGMSGYMRLNLQDFTNVALIPANAVYTMGGTPYILTVEDVGKTEANVGLTRRLPVRVQVNDGKLARVQVIVKQGNPLRGEPEELRELLPDETIVLSRQIEIGEGQLLRVTVDEW
jgi:multidrug resistance efflux pump